MNRPQLFQPVALGAICAPNRVVMAPMTRLRANPDGTPTPEMGDYYAQRADAGLIITEGIWPSSDGQSEWRVPGLQTAEQVAGWARVVDRVHQAGGRMVAQLMHGGRKGHPRARFDGSVPRGASAVADPEWVHLPTGSKAPSPVPDELTLQQIARIVDGHALAAQNAIAAGFDGIELHAANSYLTHQFLADNTNLRTDGYGGSIDRRIRLALELVDSLISVIGADRVGIRLAPGNPQFGMVEADPAPLYRRLVDRLDSVGLAYLHLTDNDNYCALVDLRPRWSGALIANVGENRDATTRERAEQTLTNGLADAVSFGRGFLRNPDLVDRLRRDLPWNEFNAEALYTPGPVGYSDYPRYEVAG